MSDDQQRDKLLRKPEYLNARWLMENELENGTMAGFARKIDRKPQQVNRFLSKSPVIGIGTMVRTIIEEAFDKPRGWLKQIHPHTQKSLAEMGVHVKLSQPVVDVTIGPITNGASIVDDASEVSLQEINSALRRLSSRFNKARLSAGLPSDAVDGPDIPLLFSHIGRGRFYTLRVGDDLYVATCQRIYGTASDSGVKLAHGGRMIEEACALIDVQTLFNRPHIHILQVCIVDADGIETQGMFAVREFHQYQELLDMVRTQSVEKIDDYRL